MAYVNNDATKTKQLIYTYNIMETKYDRQKHNRTYYEKNSENIKRKQREKRAKMKAALQQLEAENQEIDNDTPEPEPVTMGSKFF